MSKYKLKGVLDSGIYEASFSVIKRDSNDEMLNNWKNPGYELSDERVLVRIDEKNPNYVTLYGTNFQIPIAWFYEEDVPYIDDTDMSKDKEHSYTYFSKTMDKKYKEPYYVALVLVRRVRYEDLRKVRNDITYQDGVVPENLLYLNSDELESKIGEYIEKLKSFGGVNAYIDYLENIYVASRHDFNTPRISDEDIKRKETYQDNYHRYYNAKVLKKEQ